jgi:hypothetical protein
MSIQTEGGELTVDSNDFQFDHLGKTVAIVTRGDLIAPHILGAVRQPNGTWQAMVTLYEWLSDGTSPEKSVADNGGAIGFVRNVILPPANAWLAEMFKPAGAPLSALEQIDFALFGMRVQKNSDGTVQLSI